MNESPPLPPPPYENGFEDDTKARIPSRFYVHYLPNKAVNNRCFGMAYLYALLSAVLWQDPGGDSTGDPRSHLQLMTCYSRSTVQWPNDLAWQSIEAESVMTVSMMTDIDNFIYHTARSFQLHLLSTIHPGRRARIISSPTTSRTAAWREPRRATASRYPPTQSQARVSRAAGAAASRPRRRRVPACSPRSSSASRAPTCPINESLERGL